MSQGKIRRILSLVLIVLLSVSLIYSAIVIIDLNDKLSLRQSQTWIDEIYTVQSNQEINFDFNPSYAGYITINLTSAPDVVVYVRYTAYGKDFSFQTNGYSVVPVLPVEIRIALAMLDSNNSAIALLNVIYVY